LFATSWKPLPWRPESIYRPEYDTEVTSGTSTHITENNLTSGSFMDVDDDLTIKVYFRSNQARSPALTGIEGRFESIEGTLISEPISADTGCNWDTLFIDKSVPSPEKIQVTILDNSGSTIPGFANMTADGEIDISAIDISAYPTLKLKAHFLGHTEPVVLNAWGASWKYPNAWRDTFYGGAKIADTAGINSTDGRAEGSHSTGVSYLNSTDIEIPDGYHPDTLIFNTSSLNGTYINITLIDVVTDTAIAVYYGSSSSETDLTGMTGISQQLRLSANFQFDNKTAPALYDWSLNWSANRTVPKKEGCVDIDPNTLNLKSQGNWITVYIEPKDGRDPENINVSTVIIYNASRPNETVAAELWPTTVGDHDNDSLPDRMVKFDRAGVQAIVGVGNNVTLWVEGYYEDGTHFKCSDAIRVINPPDEPHNNGKKK